MSKKSWRNGAITVNNLYVLVQSLSLVHRILNTSLLRRSSIYRRKDPKTKKKTEHSKNTLNLSVHIIHNCCIFCSILEINIPSEPTPMFSKNLAFTVQRFNRRSVGILRKGCSVGKAHVLAQQCQHAIPVATSSFSTASFSPPPKNEYNGTAVYDNIDISNTGEPTNSPSSIRKHDPNAVYVVTGASRGMGLQFVKTLLEPSRSHESSTIIACCRSPSSATLLSEYVDTLSPSQKKRVQIKQLDITKDDDIESLEKFMKETYNRVDVLFNIAGVLGDSKTTAGPERNITQLDRKWFQDSHILVSVYVWFGRAAARGLRSYPTLGALLVMFWSSASVRAALVRV